MKENDLFLNMIVNPSMSMADFQDLGFTPENTTLQDKSAYRNNKIVQKGFTDENGVFNEDAFNKSYGLSLSLYSDMSLKKHFDRLLKEASKYDIFAKPEEIDYTPSWSFAKAPNMFLTENGLITLGQIGTPTKSIDEIAQSLKVLKNPLEATRPDGTIDENKAQYEDAPDNGLFSKQFWKSFLDTRVLALWDSDGTHYDPVIGATVSHTKGQFKTNADGLPYYENLDGRDIYGRKVLNKFNTLTPEDSAINKYDFFDSDDIDLKNPIGTVAKNVALVGSMFLPYVGPIIAATSMLNNVLDLSAKIGKMITGSDNATLSAMEGFSKSWNRQLMKTDYAAQHTWCFENIIDSIGDLTALLKEQRAIFDYVPGLFKGGYKYVGINGFKLKEAETAYSKAAQLEADAAIAKLEKLWSLAGNQISAAEKVLAARGITTSALWRSLNALNNYILSYNKIGSTLSKAYMAGLISSNLYEEARQQGLDNTSAAYLTLGRFGAELALLNTPVGNAIFPELRAAKLQDKAILASLVPKDLISKIKDIKLEAEATSKMGKIAKMNFFKRLIGYGSKLPDLSADVNLARKTLGASFASGVEIGTVNDIEEFLNDMAKTLHNSLVDLGHDSPKFLDELAPWQNMVDRYGMGMVSGLVGGTLTSAFSLYPTIKGLHKFTTQEALLLVAYKYRNGLLPSLIKLIDSIEILDKNLSYDHKNGTFKEGTETDNYDKLIKDAIKKQILLIVDTMDAHGVNISDKAFLDKAMIPDMRMNALTRTAAAGKFLQAFNTLSCDIIDTVSKINALKNTKVNIDGEVVAKSDSEKSAEAHDDTSDSNSAINDLEKHLAELIKTRDNMFKGEYAAEYMNAALYETCDWISNFPHNPYLYAKSIKHKDYDDMTDIEKANLVKEFNDWMAVEGKDALFRRADMFRQIVQETSDIITNDEQNIKAQIANPNARLNSEITKYYEKLLRVMMHPGLEAPTLLNIVQHAVDTMDTTAANVVRDNLESLSIQEKYIEEYTQAKIDEINAKDIDEDVKQNAINLVILDALSARNDAYFSEIRPVLEAIKKLGYLPHELRLFFNDFINKYLNDELYEISMDEPALYKDADLSEKFFYALDLSNYKITEMLQDNSFKELVHDVMELPNTPIQESISKFGLKLGAKVNLVSLFSLVDDLLNNTKSDITNFQLSLDLILQLNDAKDLIELYYDTVEAARTDNGNYANLLGYNVTLNEVGRKLGAEKWQPLAEIEMETANILELDLNTMLNKIDFYLNLFRLNKSQKFIKQNKIEITHSKLAYRKLKSIVSGIPEKWNDLKTALEEDLSKLTLLDELDKNDKLQALTDEQKLELTKEELYLGQSLYSHLHDLSKNDIKEIFFSNYKQWRGLWGEHNDGNKILSETIDEIDDANFFYWLIGCATLNNVAFNLAFVKIGKATPDYAPIISLKLAIQQTIAKILDSEANNKWIQAAEESLVSAFTTGDENVKTEILSMCDLSDAMAIKKVIDSTVLTSVTPKLLFKLPKFSNIFLNEGIAGSGKTKAIINYVIKLLGSADNTKHIVDNVFFVHGAVLNSYNIAEGELNPAKELAENCGQPQARSFGLNDFMKFISTNYIERSDNGTINNVAYSLTPELGIKHKLDLKKHTQAQDIPTLIVIDEAYLFSRIELDAINDYAKQYGVLVIALGDSTQNAARGDLALTGEVSDGFPSVPLCISSYEILHSFKLGQSLRSYSDLKDNNLLLFADFVDTVLDTSRKKDSLLSIKLLYYEDDNVVAGDKFCKSVNDTVATVDKIMRNKDITIGYMYSDSDSELYKALSAKPYWKKILPKKGTSGQGGECDYYIIEPGADLNSVELLRYLYTGITRAHYATVTLVSKTPKFASAEILNELVNNYITDSSLKEQIKAYTDKVMSLLERALEGVPEQMLEYHKGVIEEPTPVANDDLEGFLEDTTDTTLQELLKKVFPNIGSVFYSYDYLTEHRIEVKNIYSDNNEIKVDLIYDGAEKTLSYDEIFNDANMELFIPEAEHNALLNKFKTSMRFLTAFNNGIIYLQDSTGKWVKHTINYQYIEPKTKKIIFSLDGTTDISEDNLDPSKISYVDPNAPATTYTSDLLKVGNTIAFGSSLYEIRKIDGDDVVLVNTDNGTAVVKKVSDLIKSANKGDITLSLIDYGFGAKSFEALPKAIALPTAGNHAMHFPVSFYNVNNTVYCNLQIDNLLVGIAYIEANGKWHSVNVPNTLTDELDKSVGDIRYLANIPDGLLPAKATKDKINEAITNREVRIDAIIPLLNAFLAAMEESYNQFIDYLNLQDPLDKDKAEKEAEQNRIKASIQLTPTVTTKGIKNIWYSFGTTEYGLEKAEMPAMNLAPVFSPTSRHKYRIDSINGLYEMDKQKGNTSVFAYVLVLNHLKAIALTKSNMNDILASINLFLALNNYNANFTHARFHVVKLPSHTTNLSQKYNGYSTSETYTKNGATKVSRYNVLAQHESEQVYSPFAMTSDEVDALLNKVVLLLGDNLSNKLILPVLNWNNPDTLLQLSLFQQAKAVYNAALMADRSGNYDYALYQAREAVANYNFGPNSSQLFILELFKFYLNTQTATYKLQSNNGEWTPMKDLNLEGIHIMKRTTTYSVNKNLRSNAQNFDLEYTWKNLNELAESGLYTITPILQSKVSKVGNVDGVIDRGHNFVIVGPSWMTVDLVVNTFVNETNAGKYLLTKYVKVVMPKYSLELYLDNLVNIIFKGQKTGKHIGNIFDSYKLLRILLNNDAMSKKIKEALVLDTDQTAYTNIMNLMQKLNQAGNKRADLAKILMSQFQITPKSAPRTAKEALDLVLARLLYPRVYVNGRFTQDFNNTTTHDAVIALIKNLIGPNYGFLGVTNFMAAVAGGEPITVGIPLFIKVRLGNNYTINNGDPVKIVANICPWTFSGGYDIIPNCTPQTSSIYDFILTERGTLGNALLNILNDLIIYGKPLSEWKKLNLHNEDAIKDYIKNLIVTNLQNKRISYYFGNKIVSLELPREFVELFNKLPNNDINNYSVLFKDFHGLPIVFIDEAQVSNGSYAFTIEFISNKADATRVTADVEVKQDGTSNIVHLAITNNVADVLIETLNNHITNADTIADIADCEVAILDLLHIPHILQDDRNKTAILNSLITKLSPAIMLNPDIAAIVEILDKLKDQEYNCINIKIN